MSSDKRIYESILTGLNEAISDACGEKPLQKRQRITVEPVKKYEAEEVKRVRKSTGMSQKAFAAYMGVSDKTVEAWEAGTNRPSGAASRILTMMERDREFVNRYPFVVRN